MKKQHISWAQLEGYCNEIIRQMVVDGWKPDLIVGVTRGGALPAVMLSHYLNVKMVGLDVCLRDNEGYGPETNCWLAEDAAAGKKILIVDDINDQGSTLNWIQQDWNSSIGTKTIKWEKNVRVAVVVNNEASKSTLTPHYSGLTINKAAEDVEIWYVFPWENFWMPNYIDKKDVTK